MTLSEIITRYGNLKNEMSSYKKQVDEDNETIKKLIVTEGNKEVDPDGTTRYKASGTGYSATMTITKSEDFDMDKLLEKLQAMNIEGIIEMKPVVNMNALENAIYNGKINPVDLSSCRVVTTGSRLTIKKEK